MSRKLVAYFSASGVTAKVAETLSDALGADLFEIVPKVRYMKADLDWRDNVADYDTIYVGFPIWWYVAPTIINTFLESYDLVGKTIIPFATSGGSGMGKTNEKLIPSCAGAKLLEGKVFNANATRQELADWAKQF